MTDEAGLGSGKTCVCLSSRTIFSGRSEFGTACPVGCGSVGKTSNAAGGRPSLRGRAAAGSTGRGLWPVRHCPKQAMGRGGPGHGVAVTPPSPEHVPPDWFLSAPRACWAAASGLSASRPRPLVALAFTSLHRGLHPAGPSPRGHPCACVGAVVSARTLGLVPAAARPPRGRPALGEACAGEDPTSQRPTSLPGVHRRARACELPHPGLLEGPAAGGARWGDGHAVVVSEGRRTARGWRGAGGQGRGHTGGGRPPSGCEPSRPCLEQAPIRTRRLSSD